VRSDGKILVVGTTADYIQWIRQSRPGTALFITDPRIRQAAEEPRPGSQEEILCDLADYDGVQERLAAHLARYCQHLIGVACFDCESMELAAVTARRHGLSYPSVAAVGNCRNKLLCKRLWQARRLRTPAVQLIRSAREAVRFRRQINGPVVLKPLSGSGSELIFVCADDKACETAFDQVHNGLVKRCNQRLYGSYAADAPQILAEAMIDGDEYSCDFVVRDGRAEVIRLTRKIKAADGPFGTTLGYLLAPEPLPALKEGRLRETLVQCAAALGIERAVCMLDFIMSRDGLVLLELAPRPGGDCLPSLLRKARNLDMLGLLLDFSCNAPLPAALRSPTEALVGLRVHARQSGRLKQIDGSRLKKDPRVREIALIRRPGHRIILPPDDYEAWMLGHVIFEPDGAMPVEDQCRALLDRIEIRVEPGRSPLHRSQGLA
jgi:biotin carboxylase